MSDEKKNKNQLNIELTEEVAEGVYSNLVIIAHSHSEFVLDFARMMPGVPKAKIKTRILVTPQNAKRLLKALAGNIQKYEKLHGKIKDTDDPHIPPVNFGGPPSQA